MKKLLIFLLCGAIYACNNAGEQAAATGNSDSLNQAALTDEANFTQVQWIDSTFQDLGTVNQGQVADIVWHVKNTGNKPLVIGSVVPGCGCTVAERPTQPIAPGQEGTIKAKFDSHNQAEGEHRKSITVTANTPDKAYYLTFNVNVTKK